MPTHPPLRPIPLLVAALAAPLALAAHAGTWPPPPVEPASQASQTCDAPENLTGSATVFQPTTGVAFDPAIAWDGTAYGVLWEDTSVAGYQLRFARVGADGTTLVAPVSLTAAGSYNLRPAVAWSGTDFGVAWHSDRSGDLEIFFNRISPAGLPRQSDVRITTAAGTSSDADVSWNPTYATYGVVWQDKRDGDYDLRFARLSSTGAIVGGDAPLTADTIDNLGASLASCGTGWGLAWHENRDGDDDVFFNRLDNLGAKQLTDVNVSGNGSPSFDPSLVWDGSEFGMAWTDAMALYEIDFVRVSYGGSPMGTPITVSGAFATSQQSTLVFTGAEFGVAWVDARFGPYNLAFARVSQAGVKVGGDVLLTAGGGNAVLSSSRSMAFGTLGYGVATQYDSPNAIRFIGIGCHADTTPPTCPDGLSLAGNSGSGVTLSWAAPGTDPQTEVAFHRIYRDGAPIGATTAGTYTDAPRPPGSHAYTVRAVNAAGMESAGCATVPAPEPTGDCGADWTGANLATVTTGSFAGETAIAWSGASYGTVWTDSRDGNYEIYFAAMTAAGPRLGAERRITTDAGASLAPFVTPAGSELGVTWYDNRDGNTEIYFARMGADGTKLGTDVRVTADAALSQWPALCFTGSEYGVVWQETRDGNAEIYMARLSAAGAKLGADVRVTSDAAFSAAPTIAWNGTEYGVTWLDLRDGNYEIYFARLTALGAKVGADQRVTSAAGSSMYPSIDWTGTEYGIAWSDDRDGNLEIYFRRVSTAGAPLGSDARITAAPDVSAFPCLVWTGAEHAMVWRDLRNGHYDVYAASVDASGVKLGADLRLTSSPGTELDAAIAPGGRGLGVGYARDYVTDSIFFVGLGCGPTDTSPPSCPASPLEIGRTTTPSHTVTLGWGRSIEPDSDFSHYQIFRDGVLRAITTSLTWTDTTFDPAVGYVYWIEGVNAAGYASPSCSAVDTTDAVPPTCPGNLQATAVSPTSVTLVWLPASDARSGLRQYRLFRNGASLATTTATMYVDTTVAAGTTYNYAVLAEDWAGNLSASCGATSVIYVATSPITLHMTKDQDGIDADLDWNDAGLNEYVVYRSTSPQAGSEHERVPVSETDDAVLQDGVTWYYYIQQRGL